MDVQPTNLQRLRDAIMSIWTKISEKCVQHLVVSIARKIKAVLKAKGGPTRYNKVASECVCVYIYIYKKCKDSLAQELPSEHKTLLLRVTQL